RRPGQRDGDQRSGRDVPVAVGPPPVQHGDPGRRRRGDRAAVAPAAARDALSRPELSVPSATVPVMSTRLIKGVGGAADPPPRAGFWRDLVGWRISLADDDEVDLQAPPDDGWRFDLVFVPVAEPKTRQNRVHLDLSSASADQQMATLDRALEL